MKINTKYHGEIQIETDDIINFEKGLPGFVDEKSFVLLPLEKDSPYIILQSVRSEILGFVVINPFLCFQDYQFDLSTNEKEVLEIKDKSEVIVVVILTLKEPFNETTANLQAPVVINQNSNKARQIILNDTSYSTKHKLISQLVNK